ncbi:hypothetical protein [Vulgatibacter sp.]|uniref:hypothetical protein n=1 Tax=Vulgatibacter sp. TaxID=1971226 RepID=UPI00356649C8
MRRPVLLTAVLLTAVALAVIACGAEPTTHIVAATGGSSGAVGTGGTGGAGGSGGAGAGGSTARSVEENCSDYCAWQVACGMTEQARCVETCVGYPRLSAKDFERCLACLDEAACGEFMSCGDACTPQGAILTVTGTGYPVGVRHILAVTEVAMGWTQSSERIHRSSSERFSQTFKLPEGVPVVVESFVDMDHDGGCDVLRDDVMRFELELSGPVTIDVSPGAPTGVEPTCEGFNRGNPHDVMATISGLPTDSPGFVHAALVGEAPSGMRFVQERKTALPRTGRAIFEFPRSALHGFRYSIAWRFSASDTLGCTSAERGGASEPEVADRRLEFSMAMGEALAPCALLPGFGTDVTLRGSSFGGLDEGSVRAALVESATGTVQGWAFGRIADGTFDLDFPGGVLPDLDYRIAVDASASEWGSCLDETPNTFWVEVPAGGAAALDGSQPNASDVCPLAFEFTRQEF